MTTRLSFQTLAPPIATLFVFVVVVGVSMAVLAFRFTELQRQIAATTNATRSLIEISSLRAMTKESLLRYRLSGSDQAPEELERIENSRLFESNRLKDYVLKVESNGAILEPFFSGATETLQIRARIRKAIQHRDFATADRLSANYATLYQINTARLKDLHAFLQSRLNSSEKNLTQLLQMITILVLVMVLLGGFIAWWMARFYRDRVLEPLTALHRGLRSVSEGKLGQQVERTRAPLEIREMMHDFNQMTDRLKQAKKESTEAREQALIAARIKSDFLSNMSHEIRTPLNVIVGVSDELSRRDLDPQVKREVMTLHKSGQMLMNIVGDILDFSRLESGNVQLSQENFDLHDMLKRVNDVLVPLAKAKSLSLTLSIQPEVPREISGDLQRLERALINLVGNAIKFTQAGYVNVTCRLAGGLVEFQVSDSGAGIPQDKMADLFSRFVQADSSITRKFGGTGLGLAIVKQIAVLMNGDIDVVSVPGVGSTFTLRIPLPPRASSGPSLAPTPAPPTDFEHSLEGLRILSVDDSPDNQFLIRTYLTTTGAHLSEAKNGREAIEAATSGVFDIILMDIQMPEVDGHQATRTIRRFEKERDRGRSLIIALTAFALTREIELSRESGFDIHLTKPILKPKLIQTIRDLIAMRKTSSGTSGFASYT